MKLAKKLEEKRMVILKIMINTVSNEQLIKYFL